ncbi:MFS transporter [Telmatocola sphagniphila]|uniref:MFS transporter n=1 Tax=Telmatocola sphagniphila TaxID=1123043 RepID=A0A8E6B7E7_9BACT|nr:MFS transporter [Telmatocola sphagniphila]QVL32526.1 MFS transporter [Telmatocola sphagniphila]
MSITSSEKPTGVRYTILLLLCCLAMITYIDRAVVSNAKDDIMDSVGQDRADMYYLLVAFQLAYALFEIPTGWLGDRFGPRSTLFRIVIWWTIFLSLTGLAGLKFGGETMLIGFSALLLIQFLFGMGEAGAFPNISRAIYNWFPASQRGFASGCVWLSARLMGGLTPLIWLFMTDAGFLSLNWRQGFAIFAGLASLWCLIFYFWFRNTPLEHPRANEAERNFILAHHVPQSGSHSIPWKILFGNANMRAICGMYFCLNFAWYFFMYFLPGFMKENFGLPRTSIGALGGGLTVASADLAQSTQQKILIAFFSGGPLLLGMFGCLIGGFLTDAYVRKTGDRKWGRRLFGMIGFGGASLSYILALVFISNIYAFAFLIALAGFFNDLTMSSCWATCQDVGRRNAAMVSGCMNMIGNLGAVLTNYVTGKILKSYTGADISQGYFLCISLFALAYFLGCLIWMKIDATKPIFPDSDDSLGAKK